MINKLLVLVIDKFVSIFDKSWIYSKRSYSQEGEDIIIENFLDYKTNGFYVDIGAHHPFRFSNTYLFYKKGWRGINVDATPGSMNLFKIFRPKDTNVEVAVSNNNQPLNYYLFDEPALNSFSKDLSDERVKNTKYKIKEMLKIKPNKLFEILYKHLPKSQKIDFMSIDVEGFEYEVLRSNDWNKYRPNYLIIEILSKKIEGINKDKIYQFLKKENYSIIAVTGRSVIFKSEK